MFPGCYCRARRSAVPWSHGDRLSDGRDLRRPLAGALCAHAPGSRPESRSGRAHCPTRGKLGSAGVALEGVGGAAANDAGQTETNIRWELTYCRVRQYDAGVRGGSRWRERCRRRRPASAAGGRPAISREPSIIAVGDEALVVRLPYRVADPLRKADHTPQAWEYGLLRRLAADG